MNLRERLRLLEVDHEPQGWPGVQMQDITELLDIVNILEHSLKECAKQLRSRGDTGHSRMAELALEKALKEEE